MHFFLHRKRNFEISDNKTTHIVDTVYIRAVLDIDFLMYTKRTNCSEVSELTVKHLNGKIIGCRLVCRCYVGFSFNVINFSIVRETILQFGERFGGSARFNGAK